MYTKNLISSSAKVLKILCFLFIFSPSLRSQHNLKVISYNIWNGYDWGKDSTRKTNLLAWVKQQDADIIAWQELCNYTETTLKEDAKRIGHSYAVLLKESGYSVGLTSKFPIEVKEKIIMGMHHGALHCKTAGIDVLVVHLSPHSFMKRKSEVEIILKRVDDIRMSNDHYIVVGDFNAHSPFDADLYKNNFLVNRLRTAKTNFGHNGNLNNNELDYEVISSVISHSLVDVTPKFTRNIAERGSFPGRVLGDVNNETVKGLKSRLERIDYIFSSHELAKKCILSTVFNGKSNWYLSDHYPVVAIYEMN